MTTTTPAEKKNALTTLAEHITALEARIAELERCKHEGHTIGDEAMQQIAMVVRSNIAALLLPPKETL